MTNNQVDICIVGAGVIGLAIAERLSRSYNDILLIEKEPSFGMHVSSRNSEVIHSGFFYQQNSLKAKLCVEGNRMLYDFVKKYSINYKKCGKLVVLNNIKDKSDFQSLLKKSIDNGLVGVKILSAEESKMIEPRVKCLNSLWIPSAGIMDSHGFMSKLENISISQGVNIVYNTKIQSIQKKDSKYFLCFYEKEKISTKVVINCAGLWSHKVSRMLNINDYNLEYFKGDYFKCKSIKNLNCLIYPMPSTISLGIHAVLNLNGEVSFGPNIYKVNKINYSIDDKHKTQFLREINQYITVKSEDIYEDFSGIRPKIKYNDQFNDFIIKNESENGFDNFINLIGIDSPGLTCALSIAKYVEKIISQ